MAVALLALEGCASSRSSWSLADAAFSEGALKLSQHDLDAVERTVSPVLSKHFIAIGRSCGPHPQPPNEVNVVTEYTEDRYWIYQLRKSNGHWRIFSQGPMGLSFVEVWVGC